MYNRLLGLYNILKSKKSVEIWALSALVLFSFALRFSAINPPALWYDDVWVGLISKVHTLNDFLLVKSSYPPLFLLLQFVAIKLIPDKEVAAQFFPILFGLIQIPLFYYLIKNVTKNRWLAFLGAMILAVSARDLLVFSTRARHYSFDSFATILLLFLYVKFFSQKITLKYLLVFLSLSLVLFLGSFTSIIISGILIHILFFKIIRDFKHNHRGKQVLNKIRQLGAVLFFDILAALIYFRLLTLNVGTDTYEYWTNYFINIHQPFFQVFIETIGKLNFFVMMPFFSLWEFFANNTGECVFLILLLTILFFGTVYLHKNKLFEFLFFICVFYPVTVILAMMEIYPLAGGRVDIYSFPITILLGVCGIWQIITILKFNKLLQTIFFVYLYIALLILSLLYLGGIQYPYKVNIKNYISVIEESFTEKDIILLAPYSDYAFAYYTDWPIYYQKYSTATSFIPIIQKDNVFALPSVGVFNIDTRSIQKRMEYFLSEAGNFEKIYFFSSHCFDEDKKYKNFAYKEYIEKKILKNNFSLLISTQEENTCFLKIYQRNGITE